MASLVSNKPSINIISCTGCSELSVIVDKEYPEECTYCKTNEIKNIEKEIKRLQVEATKLEKKVGRFTYDSISRAVNSMFNESIRLRCERDRLVRDGDSYKTVILSHEERLENHKKALDIHKGIIKQWESNIRIKEIGYAVEWGRKKFPGINDKNWKGETPFGLIEATLSTSEMIKWCVSKGCDLEKMWKKDENKYRVLNILDKRCKVSGWKVIECNRCISCKDYNTVDEWYKKIYGEEEYNEYISLKKYKL